MPSFNFSHFNKGFTFIELVMVISIFAILSGVALFNFGDYSDSIALQNLTQQVSLEIVGAQRDSISGRNALQFDPNRPSYGISLSISPTCLVGSPCREKFIKFLDIDNNGQFDNNLPDLNESEITIGRGNIVEKIETCSPSCSEITSDTFITFCRPYPDAYISTSSDLSFTSCVNRPVVNQKIMITVKSPRDNRKVIEVSSLGQVSVKNYEP